MKPPAPARRRAVPLADPITESYSAAPQSTVDAEIEAEARYASLDDILTHRRAVNE
jgi:hypothetical protein